MDARIPSTERIQEYYDGHAKQVQARTGVNRRHRSIIRRLERTGLLPYHSVLEIGCGIGQLSGLLSPRVPRGSVRSVDISPKAVAIARERCRDRRNITFEVGDMSDFRSKQRFDRVVLPDVLEHIPEEGHDRLFGTIADHLSPGGAVCIHIPDPEAIHWARRERPDLLQIVDQPLDIRLMANRFAQHGLQLQQFERYGLWTREPDYNWIVFGRAVEHPVLTPYPRWWQLWKELRSRFGS
ncbi:MAG: class I SAM-dependent methyltransferase [Flavobacteriales bacterium]